MSEGVKVGADPCQLDEVLEVEEEELVELTAGITMIKHALSVADQDTMLMHVLVDQSRFLAKFRGEAMVKFMNR